MDINAGPEQAEAMSASFDERLHPANEVAPSPGDEQWETVKDFQIIAADGGNTLYGNGRQQMKLRVLIGGKPAPGIAIARNEEGREAVTDAQGVASFTPVAGFNRIWSGRRVPVKGNPAFTEDSIEYSLGFFAE